LREGEKKGGRILCPLSHGILRLKKECVGSNHRPDDQKTRKKKSFKNRSMETRTPKGSKGRGELDGLTPFKHPKSSLGDSATNNEEKGEIRQVIKKKLKIVHGGEKRLKKNLKGK